MSGANAKPSFTISHGKDFSKMLSIKNVSNYQETEHVYMSILFITYMHKGQVSIAEYGTG